MARAIRIEQRYCGPPDSGNGGYVCGRLAAHIEGPAMVRLQVPPPLEVEMEVRQADGGGVEMVRGETVIAIARPSHVQLDVPSPPGFTEAEAAARSYAGFHAHPYPTCFVCGPQRTEGDGLRIFAGRLPGAGVVAAPWIPDPSLGHRGKVRPEFVWAALDCPGAFTFETPGGTGMLLGEMAADLNGGIATGERCVVIGWELARDDRRHYTGTALFAESGELRGVARATWFEVAKS